MEEMKFKTGQAILVKNLDNDYWCLANFSHFAKRGETLVCCVVGGNEFVQYMPYKGNGRFLGKKDNPKKEDLPIDTPVMCKGIYDEGEHWDLGYWAGNNSVYKGTKKSKDTIYTLTYKYIIPVDKFDFNNPENSLKYNIVKNK